jgi:cystathionine beta-synthase
MAMHAALQVALVDSSRMVVVIVPDSGRGYLSKVFNDEWMVGHGLDPS